MLHSPDDPRYVELARQAMDLFLRDMPVIHIAEELHVIVHNTHYWSGWPGVEDPYVAPYPPWNGWYQITLNLETDPVAGADTAQTPMIKVESGLPA